MKVGVALLTVIPADLLGEFVLPDPETLSSVCLEELIFQMRSFPPVDTKRFLVNVNVQLPPGGFKHLVLVDQRTQTRVIDLCLLWESGNLRAGKIVFGLR